MSELPPVPPELAGLLEQANANKYITKWCDKARNAPEGQRNEELHASAWALGRLIANGMVPHDAAEVALLQAATQAGLGQQEALATITSGLTAGQAAQGRAVPSVGVTQPQQGQPRWWRANQLAGLPVQPRQWLVVDMVPMNTVTLFGGDGGTGKSLLALQLAVAVATGTEWLGMSVRQGSVIFMSAEDDAEELHRRLDAITKGTGLSYAQLSPLTLTSLAGEDALLALDGQLKLMHSALYDHLDAQASEDKPVLIVIDTLADVYPANENDRAKVRQFVGMLRNLALRHKAALMLLGHPSLTGMSSGSGLSGSTAWNNSVRSRLYLDRVRSEDYEPDPDLRVLETKKANYGPVGGSIRVAWNEGVFWRTEAGSTSEKQAKAEAKAERVFLKLLDQLLEQGRYVSANAGPTYAPTRMAAMPDAEALTKRAFTRAMESLLQRGDIDIATHGPASKARTHLVRGQGDA